MFKLKRPCANCPFRKGQGSLFMLHRLRLREMVEGPAFQCHKTIDYDASDLSDEMGPQPRVSVPSGPQQCAGLMAVLHRDGIPNTIMRFARATGDLDPATLDPDGEAYSTIRAARRAHLLGIEEE